MLLKLPAGGFVLLLNERFDYYSPSSLKVPSYSTKTSLRLLRPVNCAIEDSQIETKVMPCGMRALNDAVLQESRIHVSEQFLEFGSVLNCNVAWSGFLI